MLSPRLRHGRAPVLAALCLALLPAGASAAYAPRLSVSIDPPTPGAAARLATTITQAAGETANKTVVVTIPKGFAAPVDSIDKLPACTTQQMNARACPESTRIGSANATAAVLGLLPVTLSGTVNWGGPTGDGRFVVLVFLDNASLNQHLTLRGVISVNPNGGFDTTFDGLPNQATTSFSLVFDGGAKAVVLNPVSCGDFPFQAQFTSQSGERAQSTAPITISGCAPPSVTLDHVRLTTRSLRFRLGAPALVRVLLKGPGDHVRMDRRLDLRAGTTTIAFKHRLKAGRYRVAITAAGESGPAVVRKARLTVHG